MEKKPQKIYLTYYSLLILNLVNNLSERIHRIKSKFGHNDKKCVTCGIKYKHFHFFLQYTSFNDY